MFFTTVLSAATEPRCFYLGGEEKGFIDTGTLCFVHIALYMHEFAVECVCCFFVYLTSELL